jgi:DNA-binding CsgD family transcriptional regulator
VSGGPELDLEDLDRRAVAAYLSGREDESLSLWEEGHHACAGAADPVGAARFGLRLSSALGFKGDIPRMSGWVERVRRLLDDAGVDCVELGFVEHGTGMCRIFQDGDIVSARAGFERAAKVAERFGDRELLTLARIGTGRCLIYLGELGEGLSLLDEAMVSVEAREISPIAVGDAFCTVIDACFELFDLARCEAWTESFSRWCDAQPGLVLYRGHCLLHRAELLLVHGAWAEAAPAAREACARLAEPVNLLTLGGAHYIEGEVHRLAGRAAEAEAAYERANEHGCQPQPGLALLRLAQGRGDAAASSIRRVLAEAEGPVARARVLGPFVEIVLDAGDVAAARSAAEELGVVATELASPLLRAAAATAIGSVLLAEGDAEGALIALRRACRGWAELDAPYEGARSRLLVADACDALGDADGAHLERRAAEATLTALGAGGARTTLPGGLTGREAEVLALVAAGKTNRAIADALFISEKTVASHLSHIFTKLGVASRSAATAWAYEHGLA